MFKKPTLIIITGKPASGKTTLADKISEILRIPSVSKDFLKEIIFDKVGHSDKEWSMKCNGASYTILYSVCEKLLSAGQNIIIESNFKNETDSERLQKIISKTDSSVIQVYCNSDDEILYDRFIQRVASGNRHPGHNDGVNPDADKQKHFSSPLEPLEIDCKYIEIDTNDFSKINYNKIADKVRSYL